MTEWQLHEIVVHYRDFLGVGDRIAGSYSWLFGRIQGKLPSNFYVENITIDKTANNVHVYIYERGGSLIQIPVILAIIAIIAIIGLAWLASWQYFENGRVQANSDVQNTYMEKITEIMNNPALTPEQKIAQAQEQLGLAKAAYDAGQTGGGTGGGGIGDIIGKLGTGAALALGAVLLFMLARKK